MRYFVARGEHRRLDSATRDELRGSFAQCSGGVTHYELTGPADGELVVLAGGLTIPLFYWDLFAEQLHGRGFRTLAYSGYGRGYSDRVRGGYDETLFVRQLSDLIEQSGVTGPWHVVGTSMGALVALAFVERHIEQTATLTVVGPGGLESKPPAGAELLRHDRSGALLGKYLGNRMLRNHLSHNVRDPQRSAALAAMVRECYEFEGSMYALLATIADFPLTARQDLFARVGESPVPSMLLWGAEDQVTPVARFDEVRKLLAPMESHVIEQCGHMAPYERPAEVAAKFGAFADRAGQRSQR
ncbi:MAG: alpha/beta hydrolase [Nocardia sp.]|uniref:alpha/beta fold hydrolase n=1 Tax=Nocardia sp. TaxID=1821 RepID=UPI002618CBF8|nr:alpha/beta hydrolase [Nocardia sp.]MCU1648054.1 alpha/beta hydrolase [Nocardia sp.]